MLKVNKIHVDRDAPDTSILEQKFGVKSREKDPLLDKQLRDRDAVLDKVLHTPGFEYLRDTVKFCDIETSVRLYPEAENIVSIDITKDPYAAEATLITCGLDIEKIHTGRSVWASELMPLDATCRVMCMVEWGWLIGWPEEDSAATAPDAWRNYPAFGMSDSHSNIAIQHAVKPGESWRAARPNDTVDQLGFTSRFVAYNALYMISDTSTAILEFEPVPWWDPKTIMSE